MGERKFSGIIIQRTDTNSNWSSINPVLSQGEVVCEIGNPMLHKTGDGVTAYSDLPYDSGGGGVSGEVVDWFIEVGGFLYPTGLTISTPDLLFAGNLLYLSIDKQEQYNDIDFTLFRDFGSSTCYLDFTPIGGVSDGQIIKLLTQVA